MSKTSIFLVEFLIRHTPVPISVNSLALIHKHGYSALSHIAFFPFFQ